MPVRRGRWVLGLVAFALAGGAPSLPAAELTATGWVATTKGVNLRDAPSTQSGRRIDALPPGTPVRVLAAEGDWLDVEVGGLRGFVHAGLVSQLPSGTRPDTPGVPAVTLAPINVRKGPGFTHPRRRVLHEGTAVDVVARDGDWMQIGVDGDVEGWVHRAYLAAARSAAAAAEVEQRIVRGDRPERRAGDRELLLAVITPDRSLGSARFLQRDGDDRLYARGDDLTGWRLAYDGIEPIRQGGESWYPLDEISGLVATLDQATQQLQLRTEASSFERYRLDFLPSRFMEPTRVQTGAFLNYEVVGSEDGQRGARFDGQVELGLFNKWGDGQALFILRDRGDGRDLVRLQTSWKTDLTGKKSSITIGDSLVPGPSWARSVHLGGIRVGTDYRTEPGFLAYPLLGFEGEAVTPSTFELYIDQALRLRERIPAGPFELTNLPVVNGQGEYQLILRDALGREIVTDQRFISSTRLLRRGLREYSWSLGAIRESLGLESDRYGRSAAIVTERRGITDRFTLELHGELLERQQTVGVGGGWSLPKVGVLDAAVAGSSSQLGDGSLVGLGFARFQKRFNVSVDYERADEAFARLGAANGDRRIKERLQARIAGRPLRGTTIALSYGVRSLWDGSRSELATVNLNARLPRNWFLNSSAVRAFGADQGTQFSLSLSRFFGSRGVTASARSGGAAGDAAGLAWSQSAPTGLGRGYSLSVEGGDRDRVDGSFQVNTGVGSLSLQGGRFGDQNAFRGSWAGGLATVGGEWFASRGIRDSFAVVRVGEEEGVRVYHENQLIGRTDKRGRVVVERMLPYQRNALRLEEADLEIGARVDDLEMIAATRPRSGVVLDFDVHRSHDALVVVHGPDGEPLPLGTMLVTADGGRRFRVARRGEAFVTDLGDRLALSADLDEGTCRVEVVWPEDAGVLPTLGPLTCELVP